MGDFNSEIRDKEIQEFLLTNNLIDLIDDTHNPPTICTSSSELISLVRSGTIREHEPV